MSAAESFLAELAHVVGFDRDIVTAVVPASVRVDSEKGTFACDIDVTKNLANRYGTLHGGAVATIVDVFGTAALATVSDTLGVSLDLNTTFLKGTPLGSVVHVHAKVLTKTRSVAVIEVNLEATINNRRVRVAQGRHTKFLNAKVERQLVESKKRGGGGPSSKL